MRLIVGLGNPGSKYINNRHNVGYMVIDDLKKKKKDRIIAIKSGVFMNDSGSVVSKLVNKHTLGKIDLYIIHDDLDIPLGKFKVQKGSGPKDHKGLNSIYRALGTKDFYHVRMGVDNRDPENREEGEKYVLEDFSIDEKAVLDGVIKEVIEELSGK